MGIIKGADHRATLARAEFFAVRANHEVTTMHFEAYSRKGKSPVAWRCVFLCALLSAAGLYPSALTAQVSDGLTPGLRVRVQAPQLHAGWAVGNVERDTTDTLYLRIRKDVRAIAWTQIEAVEWSRGRRHTAGAVRGAAIGVLVGGILGAATLASLYRDDGEIETSRAYAAAFGFMVGGSIAFWPGVALGSVWAPDRWHPVRLPR